jgi:hypothetical protein
VVPGKSWFATVKKANIPPSADTEMPVTAPSGPCKVMVELLMLAISTGCEKRTAIKALSGTF